MKKPDYNNLDLTFYNHFKDLNVAVSDSENLWSKIQRRSKRKYKGLFFLAGILVLTSFSALYIKMSQPTQPYAKFEKTNFYSANQASIVSDDILRRDIKGHHFEQNNPGYISLYNRDENAERLENKKINSGLTLPDQLKSSNNDLAVFTKDKADNLTFQNTEFNIAGAPHMSETSFKQHLRNSNTSEYSGSSTVNRGKSSDIMSLPILPLQQKSGITNLFDNLVPGLLKSPKRVLPCESMGPKGRLFIDIYGQGSLSMDRVVLKPGMASDLSGYRDQWDTRYHSISSFMGGLMVGYSFPWKASLSSGIEYQHIESEYEVLQTVTERITVFDPMAYFYYDANNEVVWVGDSVTAISIYDRRVSFGNHHSLINIPFVFSYNLLEKGAFRLSTQVEAYINISHTYKGRYLREDQSLIQINSATDTGYMANKIGIGLGAGIHLGYWLGNHWEVYAHPNFRYNRSSYLDSSQGLLISRNFIGLRAGIQYHF